MSKTSSLPVQARFKSKDLSIGELAQAAGVRPSAIRYYEAAGLMPAPSRRSGRRVYDESALGRLRTLRTARALGFSIRDLQSLRAASADALKTAARARAQSLRREMTRLATTIAHLDRAAECACGGVNFCALTPPTAP